MNYGTHWASTDRELAVQREDQRRYAAHRERHWLHGERVGGESCDLGDGHLALEDRVDAQGSAPPHSGEGEHRQREADDPPLQRHPAEGHSHESLQSRGR